MMFFRFNRVHVILDLQLCKGAVPAPVRGELCKKWFYIVQLCPMLHLCMGATQAPFQGVRKVMLVRFMSVLVILELPICKGAITAPVRGVLCMM